ncbi:MAG: DUF805 domain-containing protein, partial [Alphaproteobacteria bacterium]|nr:DUF805 domain-containing protein [Alphaproteobacteria bacterium]
PGMAVAIRRCHDRDRYAWFLLVILVPLLGPVWLAIELGIRRGTKGANRFGPDQIR